MGNGEWKTHFDLISADGYPSEEGLSSLFFTEIRAHYALILEQAYSLKIISKYLTNILPLS